MTMDLTRTSLLCEEVLDEKMLQKTPERQQDGGYFSSQQQQEPEQFEVPPTVKAIADNSQLKDVRVLQNLLRNEERFLPAVPNYMTTVQPHLTADMRKTVADWMLEVVHEQNSQPEVFCLAMNIMDRFLCTTQIFKEHLQLLGTVCVLIASKIREPCPIPGKTLIVYTDFTYTSDEIKVRKKNATVSAILLSQKRVFISEQ